MKDTDEQPHEEVHRVRSRRVLNTETSVPGDQHAPPSWHMDAFTNPEAHQISLFESFNRAYLRLPPVPFPACEWG